jgi:hypothetical protein
MSSMPSKFGSTYAPKQDLRNPKTPEEQERYDQRSISTPGIAKTTSREVTNTSANTPTTFGDEIKTLLDEGYEYNDILETFLELSPQMREEIGGLINEGFSPEDIVSTYLELLEPSQSSQASAPQNIAAQAARGALQGAIDIGGIGGLLQGLTQAPLTYGLLNPELRKETSTPGMKARAGLETSPNLSEKDFIAVAGEDDDILGLPILPGQRRALRQAQEDFPQGGLLQEGIRRSVRSLPASLLGPGALSTALIGEGAGLGAREALKGLGVGETGQTIGDIIAGLLAPGSAALRAQQTQKTLPNVAREAQKGLGRQITKAEIVATPRKVQNEIQKLSSEAIKQYESKAGSLAEDSFKAGSFDARKIEDDLIRETKEAALNAISPGSERSESAWNNISESVNKQLSSDRASYRNLYRAAEKQAKDMSYVFKKTAAEAQNLLNDLGRISTKGKGQSEVEKALLSSLKDVGVHEKGANFEQLISNVLEKYKGDKIEVSEIQKLMRGQAPITVDKAMALKRSLNDIINYEELSPTIKDLLRPLVKTLKEETLEALEQRPLVRTAYQKAESEFAKTAETYDKDAINFLRAKDAPETAASRFLVGSNLKYLKNALKNSPDAWNVVESQVLREISKKSVDSGRDILKEVSPYLSKKSVDIGNELINMGDKLTSSGAQSLMRGKLLESIQSAVESGERPSYALQLMQTPQGYSFTQNTLKRSPNGREMWKALQKQTVDDIFKSIVDKNNSIDWTKARNLLRNPHVSKIIKDAVGEEGLQFFRSLENIGQNITKNLEEFSQKAPPTIREQFVSSVGLSLKSLLASLVGGKVGLIGYLGFKTLPKLSSSLYYSMLANPKIRSAIRTLTRPENWNERKLFPIVSKLNNEVESSET